MLNTESPLSDGGSLHVRIGDGERVCTVCRRSGQRLRGSRRSRGDPVLGAEALHRCRSKAVLADSGVGDLVGQAWQALKDGGRKREGVDSIIGNTVVTADGGLAGLERVPCKADRRAKVVPAIVHKLTGHKL